MLSRVRFRAIRTGFRTEIFAAAKFFVRNRARSRRNPCRLVVRSFLTTFRGPQHLLRAQACCAACDCVRFGADFGPKVSKIFRGRNIFRSKSRENAPKSVSADDMQPCHDPQRSISTVHSVDMLRRVRLRPISDRNFRNFFAAAKFFSRNRAEIRAAW